MEGWQVEEWKDGGMASINQRGAEGPDALQMVISASTDQFLFQAMRSPD
jgi:hypothetical protein